MASVTQICRNDSVYNDIIIIMYFSINTYLYSCLFLHMCMRYMYTYIQNICVYIYACIYIYTHVKYTYKYTYR